MTHFFQVTLPGDFPLEDVVRIGQRLDATAGLQPGFIPPPAGALDPRALFYAQHQGWKVVVLPDRNLVSRMARIAREGGVVQPDKPTQFACDLMAFCQAMDIQFEPSIAYHELAHRQGNAAAHEELTWFRAADRGGVRAWIDLALGRCDQVALGEPDDSPMDDLAFPLRRWNRNYVAALKIASLELAVGLPLQKALDLLRWMYEEFMIAGPAAVFALFYLAPRNARRGLMKRIRGTDRDAALFGVRNAAWDITYLSDFVQRAVQGQAERRRYIFATADADLAAIAPVTMSSLEPAKGQTLLVDFLERCWPPDQAGQLAAALQRYIETQDDPGRPGPGQGPDGVKAAIAEGERILREWPAA